MRVRGTTRSHDTALLRAFPANVTKHCFRIIISADQTFPPEELPGLKKGKKGEAGMEMRRRRR